MTNADETAEPASITIGTQVWMKSDLTRSHYRNGDTIPELKNTDEWRKLKSGAWCWNKNNPAYGKLYNWYAVNDPRGLAPEGWHVPSDAEWITLTNFLGGEDVAGGKMKETGTTHWVAPNTDATNSSGFTALPGGYRLDNGTFESVGSFGAWWSVDIPWTRTLYDNDGTIAITIDFPRFGLSVRCLKD